MKKIFSIIILGWLLSGNTFAENHKKPTNELLKDKTKRTGKVKWDFEAASLNTNLLKCIKVIDVQSNKSSLAVLTNFLSADVPFIVRIQNNCPEELYGQFEMDLLDEDGFLLEKHYGEEFKIGRKGIFKSSFKVFSSHLKWAKLEFVKLDFEFQN